MSPPPDGFDAVARSGSSVLVHGMANYVTEALDCRATSLGRCSACGGRHGRSSVPSRRHLAVGRLVLGLHGGHVPAQLVEHDSELGHLVAAKAGRLAAAEGTGVLPLLLLKAQNAGQAVLKPCPTWLCALGSPGSKEQENLEVAIVKFGDVELFGSIHGDEPIHPTADSSRDATRRRSPLIPGAGDGFRLVASPPPGFEAALPVLHGASPSICAPTSVTTAFSWNGTSRRCGSHRRGEPIDEHAVVARLADATDDAYVREPGRESAAARHFATVTGDTS